jgi:vitamin B12 transporter
MGIWAQDGEPTGVIEGFVTDPAGQMIAGAEVNFNSTDGRSRRNLITNDTGFFRAIQLPVGKYTVTASFEKNGNHVTSVPQEVSVTLGNTTEIRIQIDESGQIREEVNVEISAGTSQPIAEVSKTVNIIGGEEIENRNEITLTDALRTIPGFRVQQLGGFGRTASIKTRGLRNQDTAVLIDGIRFRDPAAITGDASSFLADFASANIGRVEVLRGSGSSVYGTNAIGGVIDFQTPVPQREFNGSFLGEYGRFGQTRFRGDAGAGTADGKLAFTGGFSKTSLTEGIDGEDDADNLNLQGRVDFLPFQNTSISGRVYFSDSFVRLNVNPDTLGTLPTGQIIDAEEGVNFTPDGNDPDNFQRAGFFSGQIALTQIINRETIFSANYQGLRTDRENENGGLGPGFQPFGGTQFSIFDGQIHTFNAKVDWIPVGNNRFTAGYEFELEKYGNEGVGPTALDDFFTRVDQMSHTLFAQNLLGLFNDRLQLAGGVRAQWFSLDDPLFSISNAPYGNLTLDDPPAAYTFDGAVSYYFEKTKTKLRAHIGNGYRVPSLYERFGSFYSSFSQDFTAIGDPFLEPERSIAFDVGVEQSFLNRHGRLTATYFYTKLIDTIGFGNVVSDIGSTPRPFGGYENTQGGIARGAEFSGEIRATDTTDLFASYTYTNSDQRIPQVAGSGIIETLGIPEHQFTFVATQRFGRRLTFNFDFTASSAYLAPIFSNTDFSTYVYRFEGHRRGDLTGRYTLLRLREKYDFNVFGTIENIFDNEYFENGFRTSGISGRIGLGIDF